MATEIERRFLVADAGWRPAIISHVDIRQAYLAVTGASAVRVRIRDNAAFLTVKSAHAGMVRQEFEFPIPLADAEAMFALRVGHIIEKRRHIVPAGALRWEIDVFGGALNGLVIAEIELPNLTADFEKPSWIGTEVTGDLRYGNAALATAGLPAG